MASATVVVRASDEHLDFADMRRRIKAIFIGSVGNLVEWYDFYAYAAFALYFAGAFFPNSDPVVQQLNAALLFAAGFLVRPLGGWLFGYLADHYGRRGALMKYPREVMLVVGLTAGGTAAFYTYTTYMQKFLKLSVGLTDDQTTLVTISSLVFGIILQPIYGAISDRIGRKWLLIAFGVCGVLFTIPLLTALQAAKGPIESFLLLAAAWMIVSGYTSINAVVKAELFPTKIRAIGVGLPYALTVSIFGGTADSVALAFKSFGHEEWFYYYLTGMIGISLVVYLFMRDTKADSAMHRHE